MDHSSLGIILTQQNWHGLSVQLHGQIFSGTLLLNSRHDHHCWRSCAQKCIHSSLRHYWGVNYYVLFCCICCSFYMAHQPLVHPQIHQKMLQWKWTILHPVIGQFLNGRSLVHHGQKIRINSWVFLVHLPLCKCHPCRLYLCLHRSQSLLLGRQV